MSEYRSYTEQMTVLDGDSDFRRCLKPSALFRYVEQVSADHARAYGMDHAFFRERHSAFLVGKQALRVWRMPGRAEKINLTTACEVFKKGTKDTYEDFIGQSERDLKQAYGVIKPRKVNLTVEGAAVEAVRCDIRTYYAVLATITYDSGDVVYVSALTKLASISDVVNLVESVSLS